ncbi:hypothetical protein FRB95_004570 [Tulasnella sp. JGI-2019a]|nr:hypothetical protein FRB95_004570 [Tulasnella sp. JGI-2019a]
MRSFLFNIAFGVFIAVTQAVPFQNLEYAPWSSARMHGIQGADKIRAVQQDAMDGITYLTTDRMPGHPGSVMVTVTPDPPAFFINAGRLYAYVNQTTVMSVNVHEPAATSSDSTQDAVRDGLYKLKIGAKKEGIEGEWYYIGSSLHFAKNRLPPPLKKGVEVDVTAKRVWRDNQWTLLPDNNEGVYWACELRPSANNIWGRELYLDFHAYDYGKRPKPDHCTLMTLHSWGNHIE